FGQVLTDGESNVVVLQETMLGDLKAITDVHGPAYTLEEIEIVANTLNIVLPVAALDDTVAQSFLEVSSDVIGTLTVNGDDQQIVEFITGRFMHLLEEFAEAVAIAHDCDSGPSILDTEFVDLKVDCIDPESTEDQTFSLTDADVGYSVSITVPNTENDIQLKVSLMVYDEIQNLISNKAENKSDATQSKNLVLEPVLEKDVTVESLVTSFIITSSLGTIVDFTNNPVVISLKNNEIPLTRAHSLALENLTYICSVTSIFCLVMTLGCYTYLRLWKSQRIILHANLAASLAIAQTIYLVGIEAEPASLCKVVAVALHYFFTSSFVWMFIEGANLYVKSIFVFAKEIPTAALAGVGWGVPLLIVAISLAIRFDGYGSNGICWLSYDNGLIWAFAGPVILVILINAIILILVLRVFMTLKANADKTEVEKLRIGIRAIVMLQPLLGLTWLFGAFAVNAETLVFQYLFIIFNALQGVFIFILHCAMNEDVKQAFLKKRRVKHSHDSATMSLSMRDTSSTMATKSGVESVKF
uniref:Probable G-protein coupled receptor 133-like n=1 Tax=Saccoglossus kowalevskii TaxID=10224 RepID=A0ABM0MCP0_SACKO